MTTKAKLLGLLTLISGTICMVTLVQIIFFVMSDISAGALDSKPETGWGLMIGLLLLPITVITFVVSLVAGRKFKKASAKSYWIPWSFSFVLTALFVVGSTI